MTAQLKSNGGKRFTALTPAVQSPNHLENCQEEFTVMKGRLGYRGKRDINHGFRRLFTNPFSRNLIPSHDEPNQDTPLKIILLVIETS